jgi:hypothetical protein
MQATITDGVVTALGEGSAVVPDWVQLGATLNECNLWQNPEVIGTTGGLAVVQATVARHITQLAFLSRFTDAEAVGIDLASLGATPQAAAMRRYQSKVSAASYIDLDRADTREGVQALELLGLLAVGRASEILDSEVAPHEQYQG